MHRHYELEIFKQYGLFGPFLLNNNELEIYPLK